MSSYSRVDGDGRIQPEPPPPLIITLVLVYVAELVGIDGVSTEHVDGIVLLHVDGAADDRDVVLRRPCFVGEHRGPVAGAMGEGEEGPVLFQGDEDEGAGEHSVALEEPAGQPPVLVLVVFVLADLLPLAPAAGEQMQGSYEEARLDAIFHDGPQSPDVAGGGDGHAVTTPPCLNLRRQRKMLG